MQHSRIERRRLGDVVQRHVERARMIVNTGRGALEKAERRRLGWMMADRWQRRVVIDGRHAVKGVVMRRQVVEVAAGRRARR